MRGIHASLTPNSIVIPGRDALQLKFDSPPRAREVIITLVEKDEGVRGEGGRDDMIAVYEGKIQNGKFQGKLVRKSESQAGAASFLFKFEGGNDQRLLIPSGRGEHEHGAYEIGVKIQGIVRGQQEIFVSRAPAYIRGLPQAGVQAQHRPVITFIARRRGKFYVSATTFWEPVSDAVIYGLSLEEIITYLNTHSNRQTRDGMPFGNWGEINIVSHSHESGWTSLPLIKPRRNGRKILRVTPKSLKDHSVRLKELLTANTIDSQTTIVWRGCNVGKSRVFLKEMKDIFGNQCRVLAPKFLQVYIKMWAWTRQPGRRTVRVEHAWEEFRENFYVFVPWPNPRKIGRKYVEPRLPGNDVLLQKFKAKYPGKATDQEWLNLITDRNSRHDGNRPYVYRFTISYKDEKKPGKGYKDEARRYLKQHVETEFNYREYAWKIRRPRRFKKGSRAYRQGKRWKVVCLGNKHQVEVRRPKCESNGDVTVPDITNTNHYASE